MLIQEDTTIVEQPDKGGEQEISVIEKSPLEGVRSIEEVKGDIITSISETFTNDYIKKDTKDFVRTVDLCALVHNYIGEYNRKMVQLSETPIQIKTKSKAEENAEMAKKYLQNGGFIKSSTL